MSYPQYPPPTSPTHDHQQQSYQGVPTGPQPRRSPAPGGNPYHQQQPSHSHQPSDPYQPATLGYGTHDPFDDSVSGYGAPAYNPQRDGTLSPSHTHNGYQSPPPVNQPTQPWAQSAPQPAYQLYDQPGGSSYDLSSGQPLDSTYSSNTQNPFNAAHQPGYDDDDGAIPLLSPHAAAASRPGFHQAFREPSVGGGSVAGGPSPSMIGGYPGGGYSGGGSQFGAGPGDYDQDSIVRYGRIPQRQPRRYKTVKRVQLYHGNLVLDCQVPPKLLDQCPKREDREFTHMRYTAATCDPDDFLDEKYSLRQILYDTPRRTELFLVLTMYNEDEVLFCRTLHGVMKNIQHLCSRERSKTWGAEGWKKVVVCVVSDGRAKINSRTLSVLAALGVYQDGVAKNSVAGKPVTAHIYEYTTQRSIDANMKVKGAERGVVPVQMLFCLKEKNAKKINSHRWFLNAFAPILQPNVCVLLDVGTQPGGTSIYKLWKTFDLNSNVGGACGEIVALKGKYFRNLLNPIVAAQNFEYKMSNILDKPLESVFGYITVLPGAFSAYRYIALANDKNGEGPLKEYFKGETLHHDPKADLWTKNMYLAEDRILCWELVAKRDSAWVLQYQRSAYAVTDVPDTAPDLISQRRRWLNGSFFAGIHSSFHFGYIYRSDHSIWRKWWLHVELFYQTFNMIFAWFGLGNYYIIFNILTTSLEDSSFGLTGIKYFNDVLKYYYIALLICCFLLALGNRPAGARKTYAFIMCSFAFITAYMLFAAGFITAKGIINAKEAIEADGTGSFTLSDVFSNATFRNIVISLVSTYGLYLIASLIFFDPAHMFTSFIQYLLLAPSYINVINVYAFCNVQDVTWGNRPEEKPQNDLGAAKLAAGADGKAELDVAVPTDEKDINAAYDDAVHVLESKPPKEVKTVNMEEVMTDSYRTIRTNVVLGWTLSNGALVAAIVSATSQTATNGYMAFLLYSVAGLAAFRFLGCFTYTIFWLFQN